VDAVAVRMFPVTSSVLYGASTNIRKVDHWMEAAKATGTVTKVAGASSGRQATPARITISAPSATRNGRRTWRRTRGRATGEQVMELLTATVREQDTTVVLVTHEPWVAAYADPEVIVRDGRVTSPVSVAQ
jgi:putative ABC transport system ATP-binding protein